MTEDRILRACLVICAACALLAFITLAVGVVMTLVKTGAL